MKEAIFTGVATALVTPFRDGALDFSALEALLERQLEAGIPALVVCGTTGEAATLTREERLELFRFCSRVLGGRAKLIAGVGTNSTGQSVKNARDAAQCGADALLAVTPYYNKGTQAGLIAHYRALADATELPLIVYNVPSRTGVDLLPETCQKLAAHPCINGIKEASGRLSRIFDHYAFASRGWNVWTGNDDQLVPSIRLGSRGVISVLSNICPAAVQRAAQEALSGSYDTAAQLQHALEPLTQALFCEVNPIPVKYALSCMGLCRNELRLPLTPLSKEHEVLLCEAMSRCPDA